MKAITIKSKGQLEIKDIPQPMEVNDKYLLVKMYAAGINAGDVLFINGLFPNSRPLPLSRYNIAGVSGVGKVVEIGGGVPKYYKNKFVMIYRSLKFDESVIGTWSEYCLLHYLQCSVIPGPINPMDYAGSLVNIITPYAFIKQIQTERHQAVLCTAGNSATGKALLAIALKYDVQVVMLVKNEKAKAELQSLGAQHVIVNTSLNFKEELGSCLSSLNATAVFDAVGGSILNRIMDTLLPKTTIYCYGFLGGIEPLSFHTRLLMKGITIRAFSNFQTETVQNDIYLQQALEDISSLLGTPHFISPAEKELPFTQAAEAIKFVEQEHKKVSLIF